jgi:hypothetical protein
MNKNLLGTAMVVISLVLIAWLVDWKLSPLLLVLFWGKHFESL